MTWFSLCACRTLISIDDPAISSVTRMVFKSNPGSGRSILSGGFSMRFRALASWASREVSRVQLRKFLHLRKFFLRLNLMRFGYCVVGRTHRVRPFFLSTRRFAARYCCAYSLLPPAMRSCSLASASLCLCLFVIQRVRPTRSLQRTRHGRPGCRFSVTCAGSLSSGARTPSSPIPAIRS